MMMSSDPLKTGSAAVRLAGTMTEPESSGELLVLLPSLGTTTTLWAGVIPALAGTRILRIDLPGHGASPVARHPFTIAELADAVLRLVDEAGAERFTVAGVSLGGTIALELAAARPERVRGFAMLCSGARIANPQVWTERARAVRASGTGSLVDGSAERWFAPGFLAAHPDGPGPAALRELVEVDDESYALCAEALGDFDRTESLASIGMRAVIVAGQADPVTPPEQMRELAGRLPNASYRELPGCSHLAVIERPIEAAAAIAALRDREVAR